MRFTKMHGIGNDYVYIDGLSQTVDDPAGLAPLLADRHRGVGGDGLILILPSQQADVRMRMFNADGSESEMCGNGVRCVAKYAWDHGLARVNPMRVETGRGVLTLQLHLHEGRVRTVTVNMGRPILRPADVPVKLAAAGGDRLIEADVALLAVPALADVEMEPVFSAVSMGNPHAVFYAGDVSRVPLERIGPLIEHAGAFPRRVNVHFVQRVSAGEVVMRTWERGSGITQACGTGACAVAVAGALAGRSGRKVLAHLPGGDLELDWRQQDDCVYMTGEASEVFSGTWNPG